MEFSSIREFNSSLCSYIHTYYEKEINKKIIKIIIIITYFLKILKNYEM